MDEQSEIIQKVEEIKTKFRGRGYSWNRFRGDAISRIVARYLGKHLSKRVKLVKHSWVEGCPTEFDLMVVDEDAEPIGFTGAYPKGKVRLLVEVKGAGVFYKKSEADAGTIISISDWLLILFVVIGILIIGYGIAEYAVAKKKRR